MKKIPFTTLVAILAASTGAHALVALDNGSNYGVSGWTNGSNGGSGFGPWVITNHSGTNGSSGNFIGDPAHAGITGMASESFGLYANPDNSDSYVDAGRTFANALAVEDVFSFEWGLNWDSNGSGNKGFSLYSGGLGGTEILNINMGNSATITIQDGNGSSTMYSNYGSQAFTLSFTLLDINTLRVEGVGRDGSESYSHDFDITGSSVDAFKFYASNLDAGDGDRRQPYFNNLKVVPEPAASALLALAACLGLRRRR